MALIVKSLLKASSSCVPQLLSLKMRPSLSICKLSDDESVPDLKVVVSIISLAKVT